MGSERFQPAGPLSGSIAAPPDKSISHRAALLAAIGEGRVEISRYLDSADTRSTLDAVAALGAEVGITGEAEGLRVRIDGVGPRGLARPAGGAAPTTIDVGNAGTLVRLLSGLLAGQEGAEFVLDGDESIRRRPMDRIADPLRLMGAEIATAADGRPPLRIEGSPLQGIDYEMPVASAQVKSALLLAGLLAVGETTVGEPEPTRDHTERMLRAAGVTVTSKARTALPTAPSPARVSLEGLPAGRAPALPEMAVPGDLSSAAFHIVAAVLVPGSAIRIERVGLNPTRVGLLGILNRMGAPIEVEEQGYEGGEPVGAISARHGPLKATRVGAAEVALAIDELPLFGLLGCFAEGESTLTGAEELRHKESDRISSVVEGLRALGAEIEAGEDGFVVSGRGKLPGGVIDAAGDHRIAMLGAVAGLASAEGATVEGIGAAAVSYPGFRNDLGSLIGPC